MKKSEDATMQTTFFSTPGNCRNTPRRPVRTRPGESRPLYEFRFRNNWTFNRLATPSLRAAPDAGGVVYDADFGSQNSHGTHPVLLRRMATLVSTVFSRSFVIANPFSLSTKAQMLSATSVRGFEPLLQKSFSCDRFPNYKHSNSQCGCCPSCLIRRLSFHAAGLLDSAKHYSTDLFQPRRPLREAEMLSLWKLTVQAEALAVCLRSREPWPALCAKWPDLLRTELELDSPAFGMRSSIYYAAMWPNGVPFRPQFIPIFLHSPLDS